MIYASIAVIGAANDTGVADDENISELEDTLGEGRTEM
jgi:hypothetical protein